ncbi:MAG: MoaD/ThiS family protein [Xanthomonadales bacterium]|nr:MoaD/ThiS family protein [Xanthomonadales bacterium]ODU93555.1 MAG: molybdopterin synthase sulfur carrier subunit [Rhodanobacter sp. SCN 66-43]OJY86652.1 MAG: molybdopterin synthase sulfur carrier subunit [Xanthomonadales bacterium 66-474]
MNYRLLYFASLCDSAGRAEEMVASDAQDVRALYAELAARHGFTFTPERLRVAVNGEFTDWNRHLADHDEVVFLPPVSGG